MNEATREAARIEDDLGRTRARLDATIGELQSRLSPGQLLDEALAYTRQSGGTEFGRNLLDNVKGNPLPVALVGVGLAWLMAGGGQGATERPRSVASKPEYVPPDLYSYAEDDIDHEDHSVLYHRALDAGGEVRRGDEETHEAFEERAYTARGSVLGVMRNAGEAFADYRSRVDTRFRETGERSRDAMRRARERLRSTRDQAQAQGQRALSFLQDQPLLLGALGITAGSLMAALLPSTRTEDEWLGPMRDRVGRKAGEVGAEALRRGERVADEVVQAATAAAGREGLSADKAQRRAKDLSAEAAEAAGAVRRTAQSTAAAAREAVQRELSHADGGPGGEAARGRHGQD